MTFCPEATTVGLVLVVETLAGRLDEQLAEAAVVGLHHDQSRLRSWHHSAGLEDLVRGEFFQFLDALGIGHLGQYRVDVLIESIATGKHREHSETDDGKADTAEHSNLQLSRPTLAVWLLPTGGVATLDAQICCKGVQIAAKRSSFRWRKWHRRTDRHKAFSVTTC
jgi:hypothetical protein